MGPTNFWHHLVHTHDFRFCGALGIQLVLSQVTGYCAFTQAHLGPDMAPVIWMDVMQTIDPPLVSVKLSMVSFNFSLLVPFKYQLTLRSPPVIFIELFQALL